LFNFVWGAYRLDRPAGCAQQLRCLFVLCIILFYAWRKNKQSCYCNTSRSQRVLRTSRYCQRKSLLRLDRPNVRWLCTKGWRWPSTPWTNLKSVLLVKISLSLSTFVVSLIICYLSVANARTELLLNCRRLHVFLHLWFWRYVFSENYWVISANLRRQLRRPDRTHIQYSYIFLCLLGKHDIDLCQHEGNVCIQIHFLCHFTDIFGRTHVFNLQPGHIPRADGRYKWWKRTLQNVSTPRLRFGCSVYYSILATNKFFYGMSTFLV